MVRNIYVIRAFEFYYILNHEVTTIDHDLLLTRQFTQTLRRREKQQDSSGRGETHT
jgi:hypothetical protein